MSIINKLFICYIVSSTIQYTKYLLIRKNFQQSQKHLENAEFLGYVCYNGSA